MIIVEVRYPILDEPRYLTRDNDGWYTTSLSKCLGFDSNEEANTARHEFLTHILKNIPDVTAVVKDKDIPFDPDWVTTPGSHLQEWFDKKITSRDEFLSKSGWSEAFLDSFLKGEAAISEEDAQKLSDGTPRSSKTYWMNLERMYRDGLARGLKVI